MKSNIGKIKKLREELKEVINEYNSIDSDFDLSSNIQLLNEEAKELNQILSFLDVENSDLLKKIEFLKEDVNRRIQKLASENPFQTILKKFQKVYGNDHFDILDLNEFYDSQNKKNSVSNKNFGLKKVKDSDQYLNTLFEEEIKKVKDISSNKQDFILNNFDISSFSSLSKEEKLFYIFSKIDEQKEKFQINLDFELSKNSDDEVDYQTDSLLVKNILDVVSKSYDDLKNEFTKKVSWDEFVEKESDFSKGTTTFDKKTGNFKNLISNASLLENKYQKRLTDLYNSPVKDKFAELVNKQELDFNSYQTQLKKVFDSLYATNQSLLKVKFDLSLNSYLKFLESIEVQIKNIENQNNDILSKNQEDFLLAGKEKDFSVEKTYYNQLCEISDTFIKKLNEQKEILNDYSQTLIASFDSITFNSDYDLIVSQIISDTKQSIQVANETFNSLKKELKTEIKTLNQTLPIDKDSEIYLVSQQIIELLNKGIDSSAKNLIGDLDEYLEQIKDFFRDFLSKKIDLIEDRLLATENFEINNNKLPEKFVADTVSTALENENKADSSNVVLISLINKKIENLEDKFANFANTLESINNKLNKKDTEDVNKNYIEEISKNINSKFEELLQNLKAEMNSVSENNHNFVSGLIESNNREREYITNLLEKIDSEYQSTLDELELKRIAEGNKKLQDLENLIILQNEELQELLDDKNEVINQIERVINQKTKNEQTSKNLEKIIEQISKNFESKIDNLESKFNEKLEEINVNSMIISSTDNDLYREITRNISELENQLSNNYESVKNSFKENFSEIIDKINSYGESSSHSELLNRKIEELNVLLDNLKNDSKESLKNIAQDLQESSKKGVSQILESFDDKIGSIGQQLENKVDWYETNRQEEFNALSDKLENLVTDINKETENNQRLVFDLIEKNNKEKEYIISYLKKIDDEHKDTLNELESKVISESSRKLQTLEDLIVLQNNELEELLDDRNNVINEIEKVINGKIKNQDSDSIHLEKTIIEISKNFESRIDNLESRFNDKLQEIHVDSLTLGTTDNDLYRELSRNIDGLENQLISNYESVKSSFKESFTDLINKIGYGNQSDYNEILNRKIDELNILVDSLKEKNDVSFKTLEDNLKALSQKDVSQIIESFDDKIGSIGEKLENKVDWYENNRQEEFNTLSEKLSNKLEDLVADISKETEQNQYLVSKLIENNNKERDYIINLLHKIDSFHQDTLNELEVKVIAESSRKLQTLEDLIILQNNELEELLDDRNNVINEIEKVINNKVKNSETNSTHLEDTILEISKNFESRIDNLESRFNDKLQEIHVDSLTLASTDNDLYREITRNIDGLENQLVNNYESVKNSFKESFDNLLNKINYDYQSEYNNTLNRKMDELNILVENLRERNEASLQALEENLKESSKKDVSQILENLDSKIGSIGQELGSKVDWYENNRDEKFNDLSEKISSQLKSLIDDINDSADANQRLVADLIENNNREKNYILDFLQRADSEHKNTLNELETRVIADSSRKLQTLEDLIILQNNELEELLDDRNNVINEIEKVITSRVKNNETDPIHLEKTIIEISKNFESRIDNLESRFNDKLQEIHVDSLTLASTDNDLYREITRNINGLENQLINNYESVKNSFKESFAEIINKIGYGNQSEYNEILSRKIEELNILVDNLKEKNEASFIALEENLKASSRKDISEMFENFNDKLGSISQEIGSKVDWYENNRQEELNNLSEKISNQLKYLIDDIHNEKLEDNQRFVDQIIKNNENEKQYIISLLNKMNEERLNSIDENNLSRIMENNRKMQILEDLIMLQNNELQELLEDKNSAIDEIEKVILRNKDRLISSGKSDELKDGISSIVEKFDKKIASLENNLEEKFTKIGNFAEGLDGVVSREVATSMSELESKLIENYESIKNSFKESFEEIENWVLSIATDKNGFEATPKINEILEAINDLKKNSVNFNSDEFYNNISSTLLNELNKFSLNQYSLFENLEKNILNSIDKNVFDSIMEDFDYRLKELIEQVSSKNAESLKEIDDKLISVNNQFRSAYNMDKQAISQKLNESFDAYQNLLEKSLEIVNNNYLNLKDLVQKVLDRDREEFTASELSKIISLENKFSNLEKLVVLQDEQTKELLNEKQNLLEKLVSLLRADNNDFDDVLRIISVIDEKVKKFSDVLSDNLEITKNISEGNVFNETSQISNRVDALSQYLKTVTNNLDLLNLSYENIWMLDEIKNFGNLEFIHTKLNSLIDEIQSIGNKTYSDVQVIKKLDQIKLDLLSIENDLKLIRMSISSNNNSDIKEFNVKKSDFIANLIKENKVLVNNLLKEKESLVKNITDKAIFDNSISELQKKDLEILLEGKAGIIFEIIFKEIQKIQEQNFASINNKLNELKDKFAKDVNQEVDNDKVPFPFAVNKDLLKKIENLEKNIHKIFSQIDDKKNSFLNKLDSKVNNDQIVEKIVNKFDKEKETLSEVHRKKRKELRDLIINFKSKELETYRKKLTDLDLEIKNLKNSTSLNDDNLADFESSVDEGSQKISLLEELIENLRLEIYSFDEEKRAMLNEIENKIDYLDDLNNPLKEGIIELESDNWNSDKFKKVVSKEAQEIINDKFLELKKDCDFNIKKIEETIDDLKNFHSQLFEIDKKLSDSNSLDKRINDLEDLVFEPVKKSEEQNNKKILNNHLKLINDNVKFYVDELEKKKIEIANFYRKVRNLAESRKRK